MSQLLDNAIDQFSRLPGVGRKTAMRLVLHILRQDNQFVEDFTGTLQKMKREIKHCKVCHNIYRNRLRGGANAQSRDRGRDGRGEDGSARQADEPGSPQADGGALQDQHHLHLHQSAA